MNEERKELPEVREADEQMQMREEIEGVTRQWVEVLQRARSAVLTHPVHVRLVTKTIRLLAERMT